MGNKKEVLEAILKHDQTYQPELSSLQQKISSTGFPYPVSYLLLATAGSLPRLLDPLEKENTLSQAYTLLNNYESRQSRKETKSEHVLSKRKTEGTLHNHPAYSVFLNETSTDFSVMPYGIDGHDLLMLSAQERGTTLHQADYRQAINITAAAFSKLEDLLGGPMVQDQQRASGKRIQEYSSNNPSSRTEYVESRLRTHTLYRHFINDIEPQVQKKNPAIDAVGALFFASDSLKIPLFTDHSREQLLLISTAYNVLDNFLDEPFIRRANGNAKAVEAMLLTKSECSCYLNPSFLHTPDPDKPAHPTYAQ